MNKWLLVACLAIAAFAVVPSPASAKPVFTEPTGTVISVGTAECTGKPGICVSTTNVGNIVILTGIGNITCTKVSLTGRLISNSTAGGVSVEIQSASFGGTGTTVAGEPAPECTTTSFLPFVSITPSRSLPWCLSSSEGDMFTIKGGVCGAQTPITYDLAVTGVGTCEYTRTATVNGTIQTDGVAPAETENTGAISEVPWTLASGPGLCPGEFKLTMRLKMETDVSPFNQIFISS